MLIKSWKVFEPMPKQKRQDITQIYHCILCQEQTEELRVEKLTAYLKTFAFTKERQHNYDGHYPDAGR
jgi:hypothetical protein